MARNNLTANGNTPAVAVREGDQYVVGAQGTWGGGTAKLQFAASTDADIWEDVSGGSLTADGSLLVTLGRGLVRWNLAGATSPDLYLYDPE